MGKVNTLEMHPMTYEEFLTAKGERQMLDMLCQKQWDVMARARRRCIQSLREYYFVGGMPEAVSKYIATNDAAMARQTNKETLRA